MAEESGPLGFGVLHIVRGGPLDLCRACQGSASVSVRGKRYCADCAPTASRGRVCSQCGADEIMAEDGELIRNKRLGLICNECNEADESSRMEWAEGGSLAEAEAYEHSY